MRNWERACRTLIGLSRQLRLSPRNRIDPKSLTRQLTGRTYNAYPNLERIDAARAGTDRGWKARG